MADFFEQLGKKISDVAEDFGKKTEDTLEVQRIKSQIRSLDRANERDYIEIGKKIYEKFKAGEVADLEYIALCESIEKREEEAVQCQEEIRKIQEVFLLYWCAWTWALSSTLRRILKKRKNGRQFWTKLCSGRFIIKASVLIHWIRSRSW